MSKIAGGDYPPCLSETVFDNGQRHKRNQRILDATLDLISSGLRQPDGRLARGMSWGRVVSRLQENIMMGTILLYRCLSKSLT
ncbi:unnamed protein product [Clonostachys chloroleuca]|uniref:Uncharacterized protein n=1 Tax=Clonostachys chloroleuca TaxID=1926264 RepID=A0AA35LVJ0_9HYPO|nr:unnamed protein product [Clonostachys chloroleuca]